MRYSATTFSEVSGLGNSFVTIMGNDLLNIPGKTGTTSHQPMGFDELKELYSTFQVTQCYIKADVYVVNTNVTELDNYIIPCWASMRPVPGNPTVRFGEVAEPWWEQEKLGSETKGPFNSVLQGIVGNAGTVGTAAIVVASHEEALGAINNYSHVTFEARINTSDVRPGATKVDKQGPTGATGTNYATIPIGGAWHWRFDAWSPAMNSMEVDDSGYGRVSLRVKYQMVFRTIFSGRKSIDGS